MAERVVLSSAEKQHYPVQDEDALVGFVAFFWHTERIALL